MGPTEELVEEYTRQKHPLGLPIHFEEVPELSEALRQRLGATNADLDFSAASLKRLEIQLTDFYHTLKNKHLEDDDLVQLVREITAYIGNVLVLHTGGQWDQNAPSLWSTSVIIDGPWEVIKDQRRISTQPTRFILGGEAAFTWDSIASGKKLGLYRMYREAKSKRLKEHLV